jgi:glyoxylase-like metal-dependent hydrolase (beta-lactamase superfamily II)
MTSDFKLFPAMIEEVSMEKIKDNIYVETGYLGCNPSFVVTSKGVVMIDTPGQKPFEALEWKREIARHGDVIYIINTDHHIDHCVGNYFFSGEIIVHEGTMKKLFAEDRIEALTAFIKMIGPPSQFLVEIMESGSYVIKKPKFTYKGEMNIYLGEEMFKLISMRGHTETETIVYMPRKKVLFAGDNVCTAGIPNLSESCPLEWLEALKTMEEMDVDVVVPGHGKIGGRNSIKEFRTKLASLVNEIKEKKEKGLGKEDIVREVRYEDTVHADYPPAFSERFGNHMKNSVRRIYDALGQRSE